MNSKFERTIGLIGQKSFEKLQNSHVIIFGLGGVGGTCFEALVRTGIKSFTIVDFDTVDSSNLNRQLLFTSQSVGKLKTDEAKQRALSINEEVNVQEINLKVSSLSDIETLDGDFIIDAVDDVQAKIAIAQLSQNKDIPLISSLGMANRVSPTSVFITKLNNTTNDPLAKKVRYEMKKAGIDISRIDVAFSKEEPVKDGTKLNSTIFVPSSAGLNIASFVFTYLIKE